MADQPHHRPRVGVLSVSRVLCPQPDEKGEAGRREKGEVRGLGRSLSSW